MPTPATIRIKPPGAAWVVCGAEDQTGYVPTGITAASNEWGSDTISFNLNRDPRIPFPDLRPFSPCELEVDGSIVWSGYVWQTPASGDYTIGVAGRGWQYHLDDDQYDELYVHASLGDYADQRGLGDLTRYLASPQVIQDTIGGIVLMFPKGLVIAADTRVGVTLDLHDTRSARISVDWASSNNDASTSFFARTHSSASEFGSASISDAFSFALNTGASGTTSGNFASQYRYVSLLLFRSSAGTLAADVTLRITGARNYASTAYESGGQSILKASDVVKGVLNPGIGMLPLLSQSTALIQSTTFNIPELQSIDAGMTARGYITAANAFHNWLAQVDVSRRLVFRPRPTTPLYEVNTIGGAKFTDAALNSGEDVYNFVGVQYQWPDGSAQLQWRSSTSPLLTAQGRTRTYLLNTSAVLTDAAAAQLGDAWLTSRTKTPLKGNLEVSQSGGLQTVGDGQPVHPSQLLRSCGEVVRLNDRVNPDTGGWGRHGTISTVSYSHDGEQASIAIDSPRDNLDALLSRYSILEHSLGLT